MEEILHHLVWVCVIVHTQLSHIIPLFKLVNIYFSWCNTSSINNNCHMILYFFLATEASPRLNLSASNGAKKRTSPDPCRTGQNLVRENDGDSFSTWRGWHPWLWYKNCEMKTQNKTIKCLIEIAKSEKFNTTWEWTKYNKIIWYRTKNQIQAEVY